MRKKLLISILALIQFAALVQIGWAVFAPSYWNMAESDQEKVIREGGDTAVETWRRSEESEAQDIRIWGIGLGVASFSLASAAIGIDSRRRP